PRASGGHPLVGTGQTFVEPAVLLAQRLAFAGFLSEARFQGDDLRAPRSNIDRDFGFRGLKSPQQILRRGQFLAKRLAVLFRKRWLLVQFGDFVAQLAVGGARSVQRGLETDLFGLLGFEGAKRLADRIDELANGILDGVELADLGIGIEQQITERLVLATELRAQGRKQFLVEFEQVVGVSGFARRRLDGLVIKTSLG